MAVASALLMLPAVAACSKAEPQPVFSNDEVVAELNRRLGAHPCCGDDGKPTAQERQLFVLIRRPWREEEVVCGWSGFPPIRLKDGRKVVLGPTAFIVRNRILFLERDRTPAEFNYWQDQLCGPDWVKRMGT